MSPTRVRRRASRLTVQGWQNLVLTVMGAVVLAGGLTGAGLMARTDTFADHLTDDIQPARVAAYRLQAALRDQETAVRGYLITADRQFLEPYDAGRRAADEAAAEIRREVGNHSQLMADLDAIEAAADRWRRGYAEPVIAAVVPGRPEPFDVAAAARGKAEFDRIRALFEAQNEHFDTVRADTLRALDHVRQWRDILLYALVTTFLVTALVLAVLMRRTVSRPLAQLAAACRRITGGEFGERITPRGPRDIRAIATDVDDMRRRIVDELEASRSARAQLAEQARELQRSNAELEQFAYVASHDLQEPLRKVASFCQLLQRRYADRLDERGIEYIQFAVDGAKRMQTLINDLLTFSRVGRLNATEAAVDLGATLDTALGNLAAAIEETGAEIVRPGTLPTVVGDPTLLAMLWQNLIGNAVKFHRPDTRPRVVVDAGLADAGTHWLIRVGDNGIGIDPEFADKVFVIFQRLHGRDVYGGTGIGLALCRKIVEHHGGAIWIDPHYTGGARICFTLPATEGAHP